jgi:hypothetical protein
MRRGLPLPRHHGWYLARRGWLKGRAKRLDTEALPQLQESASLREFGIDRTASFDNARSQLDINLRRGIAVDRHHEDAFQ